MKKLLLQVTTVFSFLFVPLLFHTPKIYAQTGNFSSSADVTYTISNNGTTHVKFAVTLLNNTSQYYASQYDLAIGFNNIENIKASDTHGKMKTNLTIDADPKIISVLFNTTTVGLNKTVPFVVEFDTADIAQRIGENWEITIPGLANQREFDNFLVHVTVPATFGKPSYIKPFLTENTSLDFTKEQLTDSGISIGYGMHQVYDFAMNYHLQNPHLFPQVTEITLPSDTNYQTVSIQSLSPKPDIVTRDMDGNWMAKYTLWPKQILTIASRGKIAVSLTPTTEVLNSDEKKKYLQPQQYWEVNSTRIQQLARTMKTPEAIYHYVVQNLSYDYGRIQRNQVRFGAATILGNPTSAVCLEFTDLFIALSRAAGIPAREVDGYGYTNNDKDKPLSLASDVLHAWPEYYNDQKHQWIMVDPTWGNTTKGTDYFTLLDLDHISFLVKGVSSTYPIPAGGYKLTGKESTKDVSISLAANTSLLSSNPLLSIMLDNHSTDPMKVSGMVTITNPSGIAIQAQKIIIASDIFAIHNQFVQIPIVPPFGKQTIPVSFEKKTLLTNVLAMVTIQIGKEKAQIRVLLLPFISKQDVLIGGVGIGIITIIIFAITQRTRNLFILGREE